MVEYSTLARLAIDTIKYELDQLKGDLSGIENFLHHDLVTDVLDAGAEVLVSYSEFARKGENEKYVSKLNQLVGSYL